MYNPNDELLDQPLKEPTQADNTEADPPILRYVITLMLFPAALFRLRMDSLTLKELIAGGLWSSLQFLVAGLLFASLRYWYNKRRKETAINVDYWVLGLQTAVELVILVGVGQLIWQQFG